MQNKSTRRLRREAPARPPYICRPRQQPQPAVALAMTSALEVLGLSAIQHFCLVNQCEPSEVYATLLMRFRHPVDGYARWSCEALSVHVFNGERLPYRLTAGELNAIRKRGLYLTPPVYAEALQYLRDNHLTTETRNK